MKHCPAHWHLAAELQLSLLLLPNVSAGFYCRRRRQYNPRKNNKPPGDNDDESAPDALGQITPASSNISAPRETNN